MATEEYLLRFLEQGKRYDDLPSRFKLTLSEEEWRRKVKTFCIARGFSWVASVARTVCPETEYYEDLISHYRARRRLFPYHLSEYVCRVARLTAFRYYTSLLADVMREDLPYDAIPNFTAADIVRVVGIGRNEYIATMVQAKSKKLMWRMNRGAVREHLPQTPRPPSPAPWWTVHVVNISDAEHRRLSPEELALCRRSAGSPGGAARVEDLGPAAPRLIAELYRRGLVWLDVPVARDDHISVPPLEGFVSNRTGGKGAHEDDPLESMLYSILVAASDAVTVARLAAILGVDLPTLRVAVSQGQGVAIVVDSEVTGYLMMGALTPACKRHAVTLFEGGRVSGAAAVAELARELQASADAGAGFEGEMRSLTRHASGLAALMRAVMAAGGGGAGGPSTSPRNPRALELIRTESLAALAPLAAHRVLAASYAALIPVAGLPFPPLPTSLRRPGPVSFGPSPLAATPWLHMAMLRALPRALPALVLPAGTQLRRVPRQLAAAGASLLWPWSVTNLRSKVSPLVAARGGLLAAMNEVLTRTAVAVQPLDWVSDIPPGATTLADILEEDGWADFDSDMLGTDGRDSREGGAPFIAGVDARPHSASGWLAGSSASEGRPSDDLEGNSSEVVGDGAEGSSRRSTPDHEEPDAVLLRLGSLRLVPSLTLGNAGPSLGPQGDGAAGGVPGFVRGAQEGGPALLKGFAMQDGGEDASGLDIPVSQDILAALQSLGLAGQLGTLRFVKDGAGEWVPLSVHLGVPLQPPELCEAVCAAATASDFLSPPALQAQRDRAARLQRQLDGLVALHGGAHSGEASQVNDLSSHVDWPLTSLWVSGGTLELADLTQSQQGLTLLL